MGLESLLGHGTKKGISDRATAGIIGSLFQSHSPMLAWGRVASWTEKRLEAPVHDISFLAPDEHDDEEDMRMETTAD